MARLHACTCARLLIVPRPFFFSVPSLHLAIDLRCRCTSLLIRPSHPYLDPPLHMASHSTCPRGPTQTVLTLGRSRVLQSVFEQAMKQKKRFRVLVAESLPSGLGLVAPQGPGEKGQGRNGAGR